MMKNKKLLVDKQLLFKFFGNFYNKNFQQLCYFLFFKNNKKNKKKHKTADLRENYLYLQFFFYNVWPIFELAMYQFVLSGDLHFFSCETEEKKLLVILVFICFYLQLYRRKVVIFFEYLKILLESRFQLSMHTGMKSPDLEYCEECWVTVKETSLLK